MTHLIGDLDNDFDPDSSLNEAEDDNQEFRMSTDSIIESVFGREQVLRTDLSLLCILNHIHKFYGLFNTHTWH